jgi:PIN domain nuclease of toxin-antitoxin system
VGEGLERAGVALDLSAYLDTHVAVRLAHGDLTQISQPALDAIARTDLLISPMVLLELEYLFELKKEVRLSVDDVQRKLEYELGVRVCDLDLRAIARIAADEKWTRDPYDRLIVAHARANGLSTLLSADRLILKNYPRTVW